MYRSNQTTFTAPQHVLDLPRYAVLAFASAGNASLRLASALDRSLEQSTESRGGAHRPRARLGPSQSAQAEHLVPDSWKVR